MSKISIGPCNYLVLLGGGGFLVDLAKMAKDIGYVVEVITSPRHAEEIISSNLTFIDILKKEKVKYYVVQDINEKEIYCHLKSINSKAFFLSIGAAWIFKDDYILDTFAGKLFNLHGTRLPQNRGGGGFSWQIMTGNRFGFCVLHLINGGIDTGDIVKYKEFIYPHTCRLPIDYIKYSKSKNLIFVLGIIEKIHKKQMCFNLIIQSHYLSTYWPRLNQDIGSWIDWSIGAEYVERFICAFDDPYRGAKTTINGKTVRIKKVHLNYQDGVFHPYQNGIIYRKGPKWACVALQGASLVIELILDEEGGNNCLSLLNVGDRFITPQKNLEDNKKRINYSSIGLK
jgi:methionyl-tRNA formyltransferase